MINCLLSILNVNFTPNPFSLNNLRSIWYKSPPSSTPLNPNFSSHKLHGNTNRTFGNLAPKSCKYPLIYIWSNVTDKFFCSHVIHSTDIYVQKLMFIIRFRSVKSCYETGRCTRYTINARKFSLINWYD